MDDNGKYQVRQAVVDDFSLYDIINEHYKINGVPVTPFFGSVVNHAEDNDRLRKAIDSVMEAFRFEEMGIEKMNEAERFALRILVAQYNSTVQKVWERKPENDADGNRIEGQ